MGDSTGRSPGDSPDPLFEQFRQGEPGAISRAAEQAAIAIAFHGYGIPRDQRRDLVQQVMVEMYETLGRDGFSTSREFNPYVRSLAYWRCIDWMRRSRPVAPLDPEIRSETARPDERLFGEERRRLGREVIRALRASCRELIRLKAGQELTYRQIGKFLGRSEGALRVQMVACLKEAKKILAKIRLQKESAARQRRAR